MSKSTTCPRVLQDVDKGSVQFGGKDVNEDVGGRLSLTYPVLEQLNANGGLFGTIAEVPVGAEILAVNIEEIWMRK